MMHFHCDSVYVLFIFKLLFSDKAKPMFDKLETSDDNHLKTMKLLRRKNRLMESRFNQAEMIELYGNDFAGEQNQKTESNSITHS